MSLYNRRNYADGYELSDASLEQGRISQTIKQTYALLTASMIAAAAGAFVAMSFGVSLALHPILYLVVLMGLIFGMQAAVNRGANTIALVLLFAFTFITGLTLGKLIAIYIAAGAGDVVTHAFVATAITFGALTVYAMNTKTNFDSWGKPLLVSLVAIIVLSLLNYFFFKSTVLDIAISAFSALIFSMYIIYDTKNIINGTYTSPIMAAVDMYLNIYNLFLSLLRIFGASRD